MPLDTSIPLAVRPFRIDDPLDQYGKAMGVAQAQRQFRMEDELSNAGRESGGDPEKMSRLLMERGQYQPAMQMRSQAAKMKKEELEQKLKAAEAAGSDAMALDHLYRQALSETGGDQAAAIARVQPVHTQLRQKWNGSGIEVPERFDPQVNFGWIGQAKELAQHLKSIAPNVHMTDIGGKVVPTNTNAMAGPVGPLAGAQAMEKTPAPQGLPNDVREYEYAKQQGFGGTFQQWQLSQKKAGATNVTVNTGPMTPGKTAGNKIDEGMLDTTQSLMRLEAITSQFKPEYQQTLTKGTQWWNEVKEKAGVGLTNKDKQSLTEFSQYKRNSIDSINRYIKEITGAAMTNAEAERILRGLPNPGSGVFDGDSPTVFKAKLEDAMKQTKMSVSRLAYIKRRGMSLEDGKGNAIVPLDQMPQLINDRGREIEAQLKQQTPSADQKTLGKAVRRQLALEFGLASD